MTRAGKAVTAFFAVASLPCVLLAGMHVYNEVWTQWSQKYAWVNMWAGSAHSEAIFVLFGVAALNFLLAIAIVLWWLMNLFNRDFPGQLWVAWFAVLTLALVSYFIPDEDYAALAVALFGPGEKSAIFQQSAVIWDSTLLLGALRLRGAPINGRLLCSAALSDSAAVMAWLIESGADVNQECDQLSNRPLHNAVERGQHRSADILLKAGARKDIANARGITPVELADLRRDEAMAALLK